MRHELVGYQQVSTYVGFSLDLIVGGWDDPDLVALNETRHHQTMPGVSGADVTYSVYISGTHLPALAELCANRCGRLPGADHGATIVECFQVLVERGELGPHRADEGNVEAVRSWLDQAGIPYWNHTDIET